MTSGSAALRLERDRRIEKSRESLELILDGIFRPKGWAAALAYHLRLQGSVRTSTTTVRARQAEAAGMVGDGRPPLRIAFASDFHAGSTTHPRLLAEACAALAALEPDVLLLGGDFVTVRARSIDDLAPLIESIPAPYGKFGVLGNHDLRANKSLVVSELERVGVRMLSNRHVTLEPPFDDISICGLDDPTRGSPRPDLALAPATGTRIVLMHSPQGLEALDGHSFDLALCGHTHGGQIALPSGTPVLVPPGHLNRRYLAGRFELGGENPRTLLVSRGVGCSTLPVRLFAAPEVHLCLIV
jgi:predicted MPP superfamily phosphohydrolase